MTDRIAIKAVADASDGGFGYVTGRVRSVSSSTFDMPADVDPASDDNKSIDDDPVPAGEDSKDENTAGDGIGGNDHRDDPVDDGEVAGGDRGSDDAGDLQNEGSALVEVSLAGNVFLHIVVNGRVITIDASDPIVGSDNSETLLGTDEADVIVALGGDDTVEAGGGADFVAAGDGKDKVTGGGGDDAFIGQAGDDRLFGGEGDDTLIGGNGDDTASGEGGDDLVAGGAGDDWLAGGSGTDTLSGGEGADILGGGSGADVLIGGAGADQFWVSFGGGSDAILDFEVGVDTLVLRNTDPAETAFEATAAGTLVTISRGDTSTFVLLLGIDLAAFDPSIDVAYM